MVAEGFALVKCALIVDVYDLIDMLPSDIGIAPTSTRMTSMLISAEIDFLKRVKAGRKLKPADRFEDRLRQRLRKKGFVEVVKNPMRWSITEAGLAALGDS
jgi:hypothetical protein